MEAAPPSREGLPQRDSNLARQAQPSRRRLWIWLGLTLAALALVGGTWWVATQFQSPSQREAAATPPEPAPIVVEVVNGELANTTTVMASATRDESQTVSIPLGSGLSVVTGPGRTKGESLYTGGVVTWVNDEPVFALQGPFPFFRNMVEGDTGRDVQLLQEALSAMGYAVDPDGSFGPATAWAVRELYRSVGAQVPEVASEETQPVVPKPSGDATDTTGGAEPTDTVPPPPKMVASAPLNNFLVVPTLPRIVKSSPPIGTVLTEETAKLELVGEATNLTAVLPSRVSSLLTTGLEGIATLGEESIPVVISKILEIQNENPGTETAETTVTFSPASGTFPKEWNEETQILIEVNLQEPLTDALLVPARAIATDSLGASNVLVEQTDGTFEQVRVTQIDCINGMCAIDDESGVTVGSRLRVDR